MTEEDELGSSQSTIHMRNALAVQQLPQRVIWGFFCSALLGRPRSVGAVPDRVSLAPGGRRQQAGGQRGLAVTSAGRDVSPAVSGIPLGWSPASTFVAPWWCSETSDPLEGFPQRSMLFPRLMCF